MKTGGLQRAAFFIVREHVRQLRVKAGLSIGRTINRDCYGANPAGSANSEFGSDSRELRGFPS